MSTALRFPARLAIVERFQGPIRHAYLSALLLVDCAALLKTETFRSATGAWLDERHRIHEEWLTERDWMSSEGLSQASTKIALPVQAKFAA